LISSLGAMLRTSLRRSRADWPIVASAGLICVLAATLLAAGSIFAGAVSIAGLHRVLVDAPPDAANIAVSSWVSSGDADAADTTVTAALERTLGPIGGRIDRLVMSESFALPEQPAGDVRELAVLAYAEGLADHTTIVAGAWPGGAASGGSAIPVAVTRQVADKLGLEIGERLQLESGIKPGSFVPIEIATVFSIDDPSAPYWWADAQVLDGVVTSASFVTHGPFFTTDRALASSAPTGTIELVWHAFPDVDAVTLGEMGALRTRVGALRGSLDSTLPTHANVKTDLPDILATAERSLLVSRSGVILLTVQLVVLAVYAVLLSASLLIEHRQAGNAMLRSRGAGSTRIVALALIEGLLLTVPAALLAPWLAATALRAFNLAGPLADIGLTIEPAVTADAYIAAAAAAGVCLVALTLPGVLASRSYASVHGKVGRSETTGIGRRLGIDVALLAIAAIGLWQLRLYGAPLTRSIKGTLGLDPLLVATPAIGLLAGALFALRIIPLLARLLERATTRGRGLVPSLGSRQLARRPLRYTRAALLLMLAMSIGVFAVSYTWTWTASQHDQAIFQIGADLRVQPGSQLGSTPRWGLDRAYADVPGVAGRSPVERESINLPGVSRSGQIVALDATDAPALVHLRPDLSVSPVTELMAPLAAARPTVEAVRLRGDPRTVRFTVELKIGQLERSEYDEVTKTSVFVPAELSEIAGFRGLDPSIVVRDARGLLHRFEGELLTVDGGPHEVVIPLRAQADAAGASFAGPLDLLAVELLIRIPERYQVPNARVTVGDVASEDSAGSRLPVPLELSGGWRSTVAYYGRPAHGVDPNIRGTALVATVGQPGIPALLGEDRFGGGTELRFAPASIAAVAGTEIPIVASDAFLTATASEVGDDVGMTIAGVRRTVRISASVRAFPATDPADPVVVMDLATLSLARFEETGAVEPPDEWWLSVTNGSDDAVATALANPPFSSRVVLSEVGRSRALSTDPVALGIIGALAIGFVAATLFAIVGFVVSASVSARERITEFALLRALGLSSGQLSVWLSLENAALATVSLLVGTALGLVIAWVVLPFITVTQGAVAPYPPVEVDVPWSVIGLLVAAGVLALGTTVVVLAWLLPRIGLASVLRMRED
jgi:hypothetical protein